VSKKRNITNGQAEPAARGFCRRTGKASATSKSVLALSLGAPLAILPGVAMAEVAVLPEVVVTARHRTENVQTVPISISTVGQQQLERERVKTLSDIGSLTANLQFGDTSTRTSEFVGIRGIGDYSQNPSFDNRVSIYVDDVLAGTSMASNLNVFDVQQVAVLRGPQGTLSGVGTDAGAISITTVKPTAESYFKADAQIGSRNFYQGAAVVNGAISDDLWYHLSIIGRTQDGYLKEADNKTNQASVVNGESLGGGDAVSGRLQLRYEPNSSLTVDLSADVSHTATNALTGQLTLTPVRIATTNILPRLTQDLAGVSVTANWRYDGGGNLTWINAYRTGEDSYYADADLTQLDIATLTYKDKYSSVSEELRYSSTLGSRLQYVAGLFYYYIRPTTNSLAAFGLNAPVPPLVGLKFADDAQVSSTTYAGYVHGTLKIAEGLNLDAGVRVENIKKSLSFNQQNGTLLGYPNILDYNSKLSETHIDPTVSLRYAVTPDINVYGTYSEGERPGGWNAAFVKATATSLPFGPEHGKNYEVGAKTELFDRRLQFNVSAFVEKYENYQVYQNLVTPGALTANPLLRNAAQVTSKGVEVDATVIPISNLMITGGFGYDDAKFDKFKDGGGPGIDFDGHVLPLAPKYTYSISGQYTHPVADNVRALLSLQYRYQSSTFSDPSNSPKFAQPAYGLVNGSVSLAKDGKSPLQVSLWVRNLTDKTVVVDHNLTSLNSERFLYNEPRTVGVELKVEY